ncbi:MAG: hypothetical protein K8963_04850 [Proteobacteria bacterium]|nr:hypothetical protein [Pseudomonadota bacterium]
MLPQALATSLALASRLPQARRDALHHRQDATPSITGKTRRPPSSAHALANPPAPPYASAGAGNFDTLGLTTSAGKTRRVFLNSSHTHTQQPRPRPGSVRRQAYAVAATTPHHTTPHTKTTTTA